MVRSVIETPNVTMPYIIDEFGMCDKESSELVMELALRGLKLCPMDIISIFNAALYLEGTKKDLIQQWPDFYQWSVPGIGMAGNGRPHEENLHSYYIYRNLWRLIVETKELDEVLAKPDVLHWLEKDLKAVTKALRSKRTYRNEALNNQFEVLSEFIEILRKRVKHA